MHLLYLQVKQPPATLQIRSWVSFMVGQDVLE
jgi:hypothetical protein